MSPTITSITESLLNPQERFRTIKRIAPKVDSFGMPRFTFSRDSAGFEITMDGTKSILRIPMGWNEQQRIAATHEAVRTATAHGYIARCEYFRNELTTFDSHGNPLISDVIIETLPEGLPLIHFLRTHLDRGGIGKIRTLLTSLEELHGFLCKSSLCHGRIKAENIIVSPEGRPVLINYIHTKERKPENDCFGMLYTALLIFVTACEPSLHYHIWHSGSNNKHKLHDNILTQAEFSQDTVLSETVRLLGNPTSVSAQVAAAALHNIGIKPFAPMPLFVSLTGSNSSDSVTINYAKDCRAAYDTGKDGTLMVDFSRCDFVGSISDTLVRYRTANKWGFADRHGNKLAEAVYSSAEDFYEGRAAVASDGRYGLIDRDGGYVMPPVYESLEWHGEHNVIAACTDGKWKLYDRCGREMSIDTYDWIGDPCEDILVVRRGMKYGYVHTDGSPLTELRFDEAFSFCGGKALVTINGQTYHIDNEGRKISK